MRGFQIALAHIRRSPYQAIAASSVMSLTFFVAGLLFLLGIGSSMLLKYFESRPQITAFLSDSKKESDVESLKAKLEQTGKVASIRYISKEEALQIYKEQNKNDPILLEMVTSDILPSSLEVSATDAKELASLADILQNEQGVEDVVYQKDVVESLITWTNAIRTIGVILFVFLTSISLLIILTVTGIRIALRKDEIEILKLVGASNWYIRSPFLLEGVIYGVSGSIISWIIIYILLLYSTPFLTSLFSGLPITLPPGILFMLTFLLALMLLGAFFGMIGSYLAVKRYLK